MHQYIIRKIVYADSIKEVEDMFPGGITESIVMNEEIKSLKDFGFNKNDNEE